MIGEPVRTSAWLTIDQPRIDAFAVATGDDAFIHVDPARAAKTRFGGTIAHGLLTLSVLPRLLRSAMPTLAEATMGANYGYDRVRFLTPVPVDSQIRAHISISEISTKRPDFVTITHDIEVEIGGMPRAALAARWRIGYWLRSA